MFVDEITTSAHAGRGGDGAVAFRREKYVPRGGPAGGDGGRGGSIVLEASRQLSTLFSLRYRKVLRGKNGRPGGPKNMHGRGGEDLVVVVPVGTLVYDQDDLLLGDLVSDGERLVIAKGGDGGRGNSRFASSTNRAPRRFEPGWPGEEKALRLELKLLADIGLIGYPSVGKSTLISRISNARPKIADYPFTTLEPHLGVVQWHNHREFVVADIPGLIEGASKGRGLGHQFLRHVERSRILAHLIEVRPEEPDREPLKDFASLNDELLAFDPALAKRRQIVVLNKTDLPFARERVEELREHFLDREMDFFSISAVTGEGLPELIDAFGHAALLEDEST